MPPHSCWRTVCGRMSSSISPPGPGPQASAGFTAHIIDMNTFGSLDHEEALSC